MLGVAAGGVTLAKSQTPLIKKSWGKLREKSEKKDEHELPCRRGVGANEVHESESKESKRAREREKREYDEGREAAQ